MFIPSVLALCDFFITYFPNHFFWYPYWYLGNPYQYLIGPVVPVILLLLNKGVHLNVSVGYIILIFVSFLSGAVGLYYLTKRLGAKGKEPFYCAVFFLVLPFSILLLTVGNGLHHIAFGILPWIFMLFHRFLNRQDIKTSIFLSIAITFLFLIDISIIVSLLIGFVCLTVTKQGEKKRTEYIFIKTVLILFLSLSLSTLWYTPGFWLTLFSNPSFGGMPLMNLLTFLFQIILNLLPIALALVFIRWRKTKPSPALLFGILFLSSFLFLTCARFLSDPDFVMDWISYLLELQFGAAVILGIFLTKQKLLKLSYLVIVVSVFFFIVIANGMKNPAYTKYQSKIVAMLKDNVASGSGLGVKGVSQINNLNSPRIFLSGSSVFWIDYIFPISQVRGGVDSYAVHKFWNHAAYQIREGEDTKLTRDWLIAFGTPYVLVHDKGSEDPFHDFKHPEKFSEFTLIGEKSSDNLYLVKDAKIGRIADSEILRLPKPQNGADENALNDYLSTFKKPFAIYFDHPNQIIFGGDLGKNEVISLAITFHPSWRILEGHGRIVSDSPGNMVVVPEKEGRQKFILLFTPQYRDFFIPGVVSFIILIIILFFDKLYPHLSKPLSNLSLGFEHERDEY